MTSGIETRGTQDETVRSGFTSDRIVHLHPTRRCNLACVHCYSESDPQRAEALEPDALLDALARLRAEGYGAVSLSGGEPLVYRPLREVVEGARDLGYRVTMITNGLLAGERLDGTLALLDGMAVSFDGLAPTHNAIRGRADAFERACAALKRQADLRRPVAAAVSLTRDAISELPELCDHLVGLGARAIQVRPVARAGRARSMGGDVFYREVDFARLCLVALALQREMPAGVRVQCDIAPARGLWEQRAAYAPLLEEGGERPLSDLVNPLVITETGRLKPITYDFDARYDIGSIADLPRGLAAYKREGAGRLRTLIARLLDGLEQRRDVVDWFDHCARASQGDPQ